MPSPSPEQTALVQQLFVQHIVPLRGFLLGLTADAHGVDDLVQETFLTALAKAGDFQRGTNFRAWVFSVARFKLLAKIRDAARVPETMLEPSVIEALCAAEPAFARNEERARHLQVCVEKLAPQARRAMELRYQHAHSTAQIAATMRWTAGAVKVALSRARAAVRGCIERRLSGEVA